MKANHVDNGQSVAYHVDDGQREANYGDESHSEANHGDMVMMVMERLIMLMTKNRCGEKVFGGWGGGGGEVRDENIGNACVGLIPYIQFSSGHTIQSHWDSVGKTGGWSTQTSYHHFAL
jgi:hypothetical protein